MPGIVTPRTPNPAHHERISQSDLALLDFLTSTPPVERGSKKDRYRRRDAPLDPLLLAAAALSGPHVTRHHYHHAEPQLAELLVDDSLLPSLTRADKDVKEKPPKYASRQAPRRERLKVLCNKENQVPSASPTALHRSPLIPSKANAHPPIQTTPPSVVAVTPAAPKPSRPQLRIQCMARTRIPTPHGPAFLHLYHNNWDSKEHLAIVIDPVQLSSQELALSAVPPIRSQSLDSKWSEDETQMDRITRGAYVGRLSSESMVPSIPGPSSASTTASVNGIPAPLIRIHSECFTGETIGSMRCDCGEQLDEAMRLISQPTSVPAGSGPSQLAPGRGAVIYMRQEGRGIGLLSKIRAYNLQDLGHDTVAANLMLGHKADERGYEIAGAILRDLGLAGEPGATEPGVRLLTNNPDKVQALEVEGVRVVERVAMVPRSWRCRQGDDHSGPQAPSHTAMESTTSFGSRPAGATLIGGGAAHGEELDKYLKTKILRMGHMLSLPNSD